MNQKTEEYLLIGAGALAIYFLFIKKPATAPVITASSTGLTSLPNGSTNNLLSAATTPLTSLTTALSKLFNPVPAPPAGGTQGANAVQLVSANPDSSALPPLTTQNLLSQVNTGSPFASGANGGLVMAPVTSPATDTSSIFNTNPVFVTTVPGLDDTGGITLSDPFSDDLMNSFAAMSGIGG